MPSDFGIVASSSLKIGSRKIEMVSAFTPGGSSVIPLEGPLVGTEVQISLILIRTVQQDFVIPMHHSFLHTKGTTSLAFVLVGPML